MRRPVLALVAVGVVVLEVFVIVVVASLIGWWTLALLLLTSAIGCMLVKREGAKAWSSMSEALRMGEAPGGKLSDAVMVMGGGLLILVPGFVTDLLGMLVVIPPTRPLAKRLVAALLGGRMTDLENAVPPMSPTAGDGGPPDGGPPPGRVVQGRVVSSDDRQDSTG